MSSVRSKVSLIVTLCAVALFSATAAQAQDPQSQDRRVGRQGAKQLSLNLSVNATQQETVIFNSRGVPTGTEKSWTGNYNSTESIGVFMTDALLLDVGFTFGGNIGGTSQRNSGVNAGARLYFTPSSSVSPYVGGGGGVIAFSGEGFSSTGGSVFGAFGVQAAVTPSASLFFEGQFLRNQYNGGGQNSANFGIGTRILF